MEGLRAKRECCFWRAVGTKRGDHGGRFQDTACVINRPNKPPHATYTQTRTRKYNRTHTRTHGRVRSRCLKALPHRHASAALLCGRVLR